MGIGGRDNGRVLRRCWLLAGALLVATVLFHDFAMMTHAHIADAPDTSQHAQSRHTEHAHVPAHAEGERVAATHVPLDGSCDAESCWPPDDCRVGLPGVLALGGSHVPLALDIPAGGIFPAITVPANLPGPAPDVTPPLPPGVRRALLQVFLI